MSWTKIELTGKSYLFSTKVDGNQYSFYLTDMVHLFSEDLSEKEFASKFKHFNSDLEEFEVKDLCEEICTEIGRMNEVKTKNIKLLDDSIEIKLSWDSDGIPLNWTFDFRMESAEKLFEIFTSQVITSIDALVEERNELFKIIRDKDLELGEYKHTGMKMTRPHLRTEWFDPENFLVQSVNPCSRTALEIVCSPEIVKLLGKTKPKVEQKHVTKSKDDPPSSVHDATNMQEDVDSASSSSNQSSPVKPVVSQPEKKRKFEPAPLKVPVKRTAVKKKLMKL